jgi:hypothetical protein
MLATLYQQRADIIPGYGCGEHKATIAESESNIWETAANPPNREYVSACLHDLSTDSYFMNASLTVV